MLNFQVISIFSLCFLCANSYKILGLFPHPGKSHFDIFEAVSKELADRGHEVTVITHYPQTKPIPRYRDISLRGSQEVFLGALPIRSDGFLSRILGWISPFWLLQFGNESCEKGLGVKGVQDLVESNEEFDLILAEAFNADCFLGFVHKFKAPLIAMSSCTLMPWSSHRFGEPSNPAYIPNNLLQFSGNMNFLQRVENTVMYLMHNAINQYLYELNDQRIARRHFGEDLPPLKAIAHNTSLMLVNTHYTLNLPRPNVPSVVEIGGAHVGKTKKLDQNIEKWINESTDGVVYFSLGSVIKGHTFPEDKKQAFLRAFSRLPQRVLWKWENDTMPGKPDNVMIQKWMQQFDILCHPNVKAFISHGGLLGTIEAVHCGVPVIVMPQFGDQFTNARALEANGGGVILHLNEATEEKVYKALKTVLRPEFKKQAEELSRRFRDRPMSPMDTAIYWIEYVARHKGAHFMRTAAVGMPWYQYLLLDVVAFLIAVLATIVAINYYLIRAVIRYIRNRTRRKEEHKNKNGKKNN